MNRKLDRKIYYTNYILTIAIVDLTSYPNQGKSKQEKKQRVFTVINQRVFTVINQRIFTVINQTEQVALFFVEFNQELTSSNSFSFLDLLIDPLDESG